MKAKTELLKLMPPPKESGEWNAWMRELEDRTDKLIARLRTIYRLA